LQVNHFGRTIGGKSGNPRNDRIQSDVLRNRCLTGEHSPRKQGEYIDATNPFHCLDAITLLKKIPLDFFG
jgi:hypothetical protein